MPLTKADFAAVLLTLELASLTTLLLLLIGTPIAWWLARTESRWKQPIGAIVALPLVLPPTVLGFYLLNDFNSLRIECLFYLCPQQSCLYDGFYIYIICG